MTTPYTDFSNQLSVVIPVSKSYWRNARYAIRSIPENIKKIIAWYGPGEPNDVPAMTEIIHCQKHLHNFSRAYVCNVGIRAVTTPFTLVSDADFLYPKAFWRTLHLHPEVVLRMYLGLLNLEATHRVIAGEDWEDLFAHFQGDPPNLIDHIYGNHNPCLYPTEALHRVRGYDERMIGWGGEDMDLSNRTAQLGLREKRLPLIVAHLAIPEAQDYQEYERGKWEPLSYKIANTPPENMEANPSGWGDKH